MSAAHALITGGAGDIGRAIARRILSDGGRVVLVDRSADGLAAAAVELGGDAVLTVEADVTSEASVAAYVEAAAAFLPSLDAFFNNAGIEGEVSPLVNASLERFRQTLTVNVEGVFLGLKHVLPVMIAAGHGAVVNTASIAGVRGVADTAGYVASKHAVIGLTRAAALEVAPLGVRVNAICPSGIEGRMAASLQTQTAALRTDGSAGKDYAALNPLGRLSTPAEVADAACFLASDAASYVNGHALMIDGGRSVQ